MKIGVGICNYNRAEDVCRAVAAVLNQQRPANSVVVLDNASTDDSVNRLTQQFGNRIEIVSSDTNTGGAGGFSRLSALLSDRELDAIVLLDSDCFLHPLAIQHLENALATNPQIGVCGARIMHADRPDTIQECGAFIDWEEASFKLNRRDQALAAKSSLPALEYVDYVPACALIARVEVFKKSGHFDSDFFIYFDDIDWCHRTTLAGYKIAVANLAEALHTGGGKVKTNHFPTYYFWRNRFRFFTKHSDTARDFLLQNGAQAIATSRTLQLNNAADIIREALLDALSGKSGPKDFSELCLTLDPASPFLVSAGEPGPERKVTHIFKPNDASDDTILVDSFGKRIFARQSRNLYKNYQENLQIATDELERRST